MYFIRKAMILRIIVVYSKKKCFVKMDNIENHHILEGKRKHFRQTDYNQSHDCIA